jgi:hypothetical protein
MAVRLAIISNALKVASMHARYDFLKVVMGGLLERGVGNRLIILPHRGVCKQRFVGRIIQSIEIV